MDRTPQVTILMLAYNRAKFIGGAIDSVLAQSFSDWELVIINDGSTDETKAIIESCNDPRITLIAHEENKGLFVSRAESLGFAEGEYTAVLDSDDIWTDSEKLAKQVAFLEENPDVVLLGTQTNIIGENGSILDTSNFATTDKNIRKRILFQNQFTHSAVMMRISAVQQTIGYQPTLAEDLELFLQLGTLGKFANLNDVCTAHRTHSESVNDHGVNMLSAVAAIVDKHKKNYPFGSIALLLLRVRLLLRKVLYLSFDRC